MARRHVTAARAFVLLLLGVGIGAVLFVNTSLSPDRVKAQVEDALREYVSTRFELDDVDLHLTEGVELSGLRIFHSDPSLPPAVEAERIVLTVDQGELLSGSVHIRQVKVEGLVLRLRTQGEGFGLPGLPGVFAPPRISASEGQPWLPTIFVEPGSGGSRVEVLTPVLLSSGEPLSLRCDSFEAQQDGPYYDVTARFFGASLGEVGIHLSLDHVEGTVKFDGSLNGMHWARKEVRKLAPALLERIPPIEFGGDGGMTVEGVALLRPLELTQLAGKASLSNLHGAFGNLYTGQRFGLPFRVSNGKTTVEFDLDMIRVPDFEAEFRTPSGGVGTIEIDASARTLDPEAETDLHLIGRGLSATTHDLRMLFDPDLVETIVDRYLPGGRCDFEHTIALRAGVPKRESTRLHIEDGRFNYAGRLDALTNRRFGFRYPLDRCSGDILIETNIPTPQGLCERIEIKNIRGFNRIDGQPADRPQDVEVTANGQILTFETPDGRSEDEVDLRIQVRDLPIDAKLAGAFASSPDGVPYRAFDLRGWADTVDIHIERQAFKDTREHSTIEVALRDCTLAYENFPLRVEGLSARVISREIPVEPDGRLSRTLAIDRMKGDVVDGGRLTGGATLVESPEGELEISVNLKVTDLALGRNLGRALRLSPMIESTVSETWYRVRPYGLADAFIEIDPSTGINVKIDFGGRTCLGGYAEADCPITDLKGTLLYTDGTLKLEGVEGRLGDAPILITGRVRPDTGPELSAQVQGLPLDARVLDLARNLAPAVAPFLDRLDLQPRSRLDLTVVTHRDTEGGEGIAQQLRLDGLELYSRVLDQVVEIEGGPITLDAAGVSGSDISLRSGSEQVRIRSFLVPDAAGDPVQVHLDAKNLAARGHIRHLLGTQVRNVLGENLRIDLDGLRIAYTPGSGRIQLKGEAELRRHTLSDEQVEVLEPTGTLEFRDVYVRLPDRANGPIKFHGVLGFRGFNMNLPIALEDLSGQLNIAEGIVTDAFHVRGALVQGEGWLYGRYVDRLAMNLVIDPNYFKFDGIEARLYGGKLEGSVAVHRDEPAAFEVRLAVTDVELGEMLKEDLSRDDPMSGVLSAVIELRSQSGEVEDMEGSGSASIEDGELVRVPGLRSFFAALGRVTPASELPRYKKAVVDFDVADESLLLGKLTLSTPLNDVNVYGRISIYGDLNLIIEPQVTKLIDLPRLANVPVLSTLADIWHRTVYGIFMEGTLGSPELRIRALPFIKRDIKPFTQSPHAGQPQRMRPRIVP